MANAQGVDISVWQDNNSTPQMFDPYKARARGASFVGIKVSQGNWADPDYLLNWAHCRNVLYRLPYHFLTWDIAPNRQAETFWSLVEKDTLGILPLTVDFEWWKQTPAKAMDIVYNFTYRLKQLADPLPQGLYTALEFWKPNGSSDAYWEQFYLWLCDISGEVQVPVPWDKWAFHQYTFKLRGPDWGAESLDLDGDYFNGSLTEMQKEFNLPALEGLTEPTKPEPPQEEPMVDYSKNAMGLFTNDANWPNPNYDFVLGYAGKGYATPNSLLKAIETKALQQGAVFIGHYQFSMAYYTGQQYPMESSKWPAHHMDYPMQMFERAFLNRKVQAIVIEVTDANDHTGKPGSPAWVSFAAREFMERANAWMKIHKPGVPLILGSSNAFIQKYAPGMNSWAHNYPSLICQDAPLDPKTSYPLGTEKPMYLGASDGFWGWKYYAHLVLFNGDTAKLNKYFGIAPKPEPVPATQGIVNLQGLNLRSDPNPSDDTNRLGTLRLGAPVEILGRETDAAGNVWFKVRVEGFVAATWKGKTYVKEV
jgi:GH25 family lysozyme M1 (1,4-beta-N-acetylmuramidase)